MASLIKTLFADIRPNLIYDVVKYLFLTAVAAMATVLFIIIRYLSGYPLSLVLALIIFIVAFLLMITGIAISKYARKREVEMAPRTRPQLLTVEEAMNPLPNEPIDWEARCQGLLLQNNGLQKHLKKAEDAAIEERNKFKALEERIEKYPCPDDWLHKMADHDAELISSWVHVVAIHCQNRMTGGVLPYYYFSFEIENWSVYPIRIESLTGKIRFAAHDFRHDPVILQDHRSLVVRPRENKILTIEQQLYAEEVKHIETAKESEDFMFGALKIIIKGAGQFADRVQEGQLKTNYGVSRNNPHGFGNSLHQYA